MDKTQKQCAFIITNDYGFDPRSNVKYEPHFKDYQNHYYTFANWKDKSNILIKFNPAELVHE